LTSTTSTTAKAALVRRFLYNSGKGGSSTSNSSSSSLYAAGVATTAAASVATFWAYYDGGGCSDGFASRDDEQQRRHEENCCRRGNGFVFETWRRRSKTSYFAPPLNATACSSSTDDDKDKRIVIVGGGTGGIGVAAMIRNEGLSRDITVVEPSRVHYYQPLWTLVGGGVKDHRQSRKPTEDVIPKGTKWIPQGAKKFVPDDNVVVLDDGTSVEYDYLVVAAGLKSDFGAIPGMKEGLEQSPTSGVVSIYSYDYSPKVWSTFNHIVATRLNKGMKSEFVFTMPNTTLKCAGAPQKIMWLLEDILRSRGFRGNGTDDAALADVKFVVPGASMFAVPYYAKKIDKMRTDKNVEAKFQHVLVSIDVPAKVATFLDKSTGRKVKQSYDLLHVCPNMVPHDFLKHSPLADEAGWVDVDKNTLQSKKYPNVFALGDCTNTPNSKTAAAITSQAPVLVHNLQRHARGEPIDGAYVGYASCPLIIGVKKLIMLEFGYGGKLMETFSPETGKFPWKYVGTDGAVQNRFMYFLKEQVFPYVYWKLWVKGRWYGTETLWKPKVPTLADIGRDDNNK